MSDAHSQTRLPFSLCGVLAVLLGLLFLLQHSSGCLAGTEALLENSKLEPAGGSAYAWSIPAKLRQSEIPSNVRLTEDGAPLTRAQASSQVRGESRGLFSVSLKQVWLSPADGTDPRENRRKYEIYVPRSVPKGVLVLAWLLVFSGVVLMIRGFWGLWFWTVWQEPRKPDVPQPKLNREWSLDAIRGIAIILVLFAHVPHPIGLPEFWKPTLLFLNRGGWTGVDIFFVLSGYLISGLLLEEWRKTGSVKVGRFLYRRAWKIYPAHWVLILATLVSMTFIPLPSAEVSVDRVIQELLYLQNYLGGVWPHTWSLGVEEQFYLFLAFAMGASRAEHTKDNDAPRWLPRLAFCICLICPVLRILRFLHGEAYGVNYVSTHLRADSLMWGVLLRYFRHVQPCAFARWGGRLRVMGLPIVALLLFPSFVFGRNAWTMSFNLTAISLAACLLIICLFGWQQTRGTGLALTPLCFLGRHSYTLYLWHFPLAQFFATYYAWENRVSVSMAWFGAYVVTTVIVSLGASWLIEEPLLRLRDRLVPSGIGSSEPSRV